MKKRLVFYFYGFKKYKDNRAIQIHLNCLKHYANIFDEALFVISLDNVNDNELFLSIVKDILECGFKNVTFKRHQNTKLCEGEVFYNEIVNKLSDLDGLTFFAHTKGITNYDNYDAQESLDNWILGMYYFNLNFMDDVETKFCSDISRFYGTFLMMEKKEMQHSTKNGFLYCGTFFWLNAQHIKYDLDIGNITLPKGCYQRGYAEIFPSFLYKWDGGKYLSSYCNRMLYFYDPYVNTTMKTIGFLLRNDEESINEFTNFKNNMLQKKALD